MQAVHLVTDVVDDILHVTINRAAKRNALSSEVLAELGGVMEHHAAAPALLAAVITGAGDKCFAAGGDLREFDGLRSEADVVAMATAAARALDAIRDFPVPVLAVLNGDAIGGGAELAVACDMRLFAGHARIAFVQGLLNISPAWGGGIDLMRIVGGANALRLLCRCEFIDAAEALTLGLAQAVAEPGESIEEALTKFLVPVRKRKPQVMRAFKALAVAARKGSQWEAIRALEKTLLVANWCHPDHWSAHEEVLARISE